MKIGMAISAGILLLLVGILYLKTRPGSADGTTNASSEANLALQSLPDDLPNFGLSSTGDAADASALFSAINRNKNILRAGGYAEEKPQKAAEVVDALVKAGSGNLKEGFIDNKVSGDKAFESPETKQAITTLSTAVNIHIEHTLEAAQFDSAQTAAAALLQLGRQTFEKNVRLKSRQRGLAMMNLALRHIGTVAYTANQDGEIDDAEYTRRTDAARKWLDAIKKIEDTWNAKLKSIETVAPDKGLPNVGDLVKIAKEDKDRTFRVFAARRLGYALFERVDSGNLKAINTALDELEKSDDAMVAAAAKGGRSIKDKADYHELRK